MPKINKRDIEEEYGLSYALFKTSPELMHLLNKAVSASWTAARFQVELRQTDWFKNHSDSWRQGMALKYSDPSTWHEKLTEARTSVQDLAGQYGINLGSAGLNRLAERSLLLGWSDGDVRNAVANYVRPGQNGDYGGDLSGIQSQLEQTALNNGVRVGGPEIKKWMQAIVRGDASQDQYQQHIRDIAAKTFEAYGSQIKAGMDLSDLASPYVQSMSQILEMNPNSINMFDPTIRKAMAGVRDTKGNVTPTSITDFEDSLRQDRRWQFTKQAQDSARDFATALGKAWGLQG